MGLHKTKRKIARASLCVLDSAIDLKEMANVVFDNDDVVVYAIDSAVAHLRDAAERLNTKESNLMRELEARVREKSLATL